MFRFNYNIPLLSAVLILLTQHILVESVEIKKEYDYFSASLREALEARDGRLKYLVDVTPEHLVQEGKMIPGSYHLPFEDLSTVLSMTEEEFEWQFEVKKPSKLSDMIFTCLDGKHAKEAAEWARNYGWKNSKAYIGPREDLYEDIRAAAIE
uniref:Rhodanese domain-containing protein n=1 Tax=Glossina brevipalpis TaxID=37001 RepID=A0A1A9X351_9MUSC